MQIERITFQSELIQFNNRMTELTGVEFPVRYYQQCDVFACYDAERKMMGGYAFKLEPPYRVLGSLSHQPQAYIQFFQNVELSQIMEQSALWIEPESMSIRDKSKFFQSMMQHLFQYARDYMLFGYNLNKTALRKLYSRMKPRTLFQGELFGEGRDAFPLCIDCVQLSELKHLVENSVLAQKC